MSRLWQIHAFGEGNTRTIKYLRSLGFNVSNDIFADNSWYFRNALVRANYTNLQKGIEENPAFLENFFRNLLLGEHNELKNRYCHIKYMPETVQKTAQKIIFAIKENPFITREKLSELCGISSSGMKWQLKQLQTKKLIRRVGPDKGGRWEVVEEEI